MPAQTCGHFFWSHLSTFFRSLSGFTRSQKIMTTAGFQSEVVLLHQLYKMQGKMKTTTLLIAAVLSIFSTGVFAGSDSPVIKPNNELVAPVCISLIPIAPTEATFEDEISAYDLAKWAPVTPAEATFDDDADAISPELLQALAPVAPKVADFDDDPDQILDLTSLSPITPGEADFAEDF